MGEGFPSILRLTNYDAIMQIKEAIERAATLESGAVVAELEKMEYRGTMGRYVFNTKDHKWPHNVPYGPNEFMLLGGQWQNGELMTVFPDGRKPAFEEGPGWEGLRYEGTVNFKLPPRVKTFWKK
jgi:branched-chain amino acid transport system substrate-binding protein